MEPKATAVPVTSAKLSERLGALASQDMVAEAAKADPAMSQRLANEVPNDLMTFLLAQMTKMVCAAAIHATAKAEAATTVPDPPAPVPPASLEQAAAAAVAEAAANLIRLVEEPGLQAAGFNPADGDTASHRSSPIAT